MDSLRMTCVKKFSFDHRHTSRSPSVSRITKSYVCPEVNLRGRSLLDVFVTVRTKRYPSAVGLAVTATRGLSSLTDATGGSRRIGATGGGITTALSLGFVAVGPAGRVVGAAGAVTSFAITGVPDRFI